jgi:hypothetical protein
MYSGFGIYAEPKVIALKIIKLIDNWGYYFDSDIDC